MTKRMTLEELGAAFEARGLKGISFTLSPMDPEVLEALQQISEDHQEALRKGEDYLKNPLWNTGGSCPSCGSKRYFDLFGGTCNKHCANCGECYDCIGEE